MTAVLFLIHWPRADYFLPEHHTDLEFSRTLLSVKDEVMVKALSVEWREGLNLGRVREVAIPWDIVEQEAHDCGSYIFIILSLPMSDSLRAAVHRFSKPFRNRRNFGKSSQKRFQLSGDFQIMVAYLSRIWGLV